MNRKKFLTTATLAAFSISTFAALPGKDDEDPKESCETSKDILGPFYRPKAPERSDLTFEGLEGSIIQLKGKVYESDCITPIKNAKIEIWHCDTEGKYDNVTKEYKHRAIQYSNEEGEYEFKTILPGKYLNGRLYRPAHIHFRVKGKKRQELISQIYFTGDPQIEEDPWASQKNASHRILPIILEDTQGSLTVNFDIYLKEK